MFNRHFFFIYQDGPSIGVSLNISKHTELTKNEKSLLYIFCRFRATSNFCSLNYFEQCNRKEKQIV